MLNIFLYGYVLFVVICSLIAIWFQYFSVDQKSNLGAAVALIFGFIPLVNIWYTLVSIAYIPHELKGYIKEKKDKKKFDEYFKDR